MSGCHHKPKVLAQHKARELGCTGVHAMGTLWMPCAEHPR
jgi:hypothetical protein